MSAVIVVHNGARYLGDAIESAVAQQVGPDEVLVIDDGSTDESAALARRFGPPVRCLSQARRGIGGARNAGIASSTGDYVAFLDADDLWTPRTLACLLAAFAGRPQPELVFGHVREFISPDIDESSGARLACRSDLVPGYLIGACLIGRDTLARVGDFAEDVVTGEFVDWIARAHELNVREALIDDHVLWRRLHQSNHGLVNRERRADLATILKRALDRRRA